MDEKKEIKFNLAVLGKNKTLKQPTYGCLKGGKNPTFRQTRTITPDLTHVATPQVPKRIKSNTIKHYTSFGKKGGTVKVLVKGTKDFKSIENEKRKLDKHPLSEICNYLAIRNLYTPGSNAPEEVLREIYKNAYLAGNITNNNPEKMIENYMSDAPEKLIVEKRE
jgi:hypothetical protein